MAAPTWLDFAAKLAEIVGALAGVMALVLQVVDRGKRESVPALGSSAPVPRHWLRISLALFCIPLLALILQAGNLAPSAMHPGVDAVAAVAGLAACLALVLYRVSLRRQWMPLPGSLRTMLERQRELSQRHQYSYSVGSAPPVLDIYVDQRAEWLGPGPMAGAVPLTLAQMLRGSRNAVVLADPGVGKSTAIARVAWQQSAWWLDARRSEKPRDAPYGPVIPIVLPADLLGSESLPAAMAWQWEQLTGFNVDAQVFERKPPCAEFWLVLIDGIDQVLSPVNSRGFGVSAVRRP